jgi:hypothetical protein
MDSGAASGAGLLYEGEISSLSGVRRLSIFVTTDADLKRISATIPKPVLGEERYGLIAGAVRSVSRFGY